MSTPFEPSDPSQRDAFDDALRAHFEHFQDTPTSDAWEELVHRMPRGPLTEKPALKPTTRWRAWRPFAGGVAVGVLLMLGVGSGIMPSADLHRITPEETPLIAATDRTFESRPARTSVQLSAVSHHPVSNSDPAVSGTVRPTAPVLPHAWLASNQPIVGTPALTKPPGNHSTPALLSASTPDSLPNESARQIPALPALAQAWLRATARNTQLQEASAAALTTPTDTTLARRAQVLANAQLAELSALSAAIDSLKHALPMEPPTIAAVVPKDSVAEIYGLPAPSRWAALLTAETTPSWSVLPSRASGTIGHEQTAASLSQGVQMQYQPAKRWRLRAGIGQQTLQTQLRTLAERNGERAITDSVLTTEVRSYQTSTVVNLVHLDTVVVLEPILNGSAQLVGYDTSYVIHADTTRTITTTQVNDTVHRKIVTHRLETFRERQQQLFRPTYRFWTLPVAVQYALVTQARWRLGLTLGAQVAIYRGGSRPVLNTAGDGYELRAVTAREAGFRPVSLSLSGGLEAEYRLSARLSATLAPTVRWGVVPAGRTGEAASLRPLLPAAVVGLSYSL